MRGERNSHAPAILQPKKTKTKSISEKQYEVSKDPLLHKSFGVPILVVRVLKISAEMMAPVFPPAVSSCLKFGGENCNQRTLKKRLGSDEERNFYLQPDNTDETDFG